MVKTQDVVRRVPVTVWNAVLGMRLRAMRMALNKEIFERRTGKGQEIFQVNTTEGLIEVSKADMLVALQKVERLLEFPRFVSHPDTVYAEPGWGFLSEDWFPKELSGYNSMPEEILAWVFSGKEIIFLKDRAETTQDTFLTEPVTAPTEIYATPFNSFILSTANHRTVDLGLPDGGDFGTLVFDTFLCCRMIDGLHIRPLVRTRKDPRSGLISEKVFQKSLKRMRLIKNQAEADRTWLPMMGRWQDFHHFWDNHAAIRLYGEWTDNDTLIMPGGEDQVDVTTSKVQSDRFGNDVVSTVVGKLLPLVFWALSQLEEEPVENSSLHRSGDVTSVSVREGVDLNKAVFEPERIFEIAGSRYRGAPKGQEKRGWKLDYQRKRPDPHWRYYGPREMADGSIRQPFRVRVNKALEAGIAPGKVTVVSNRKGS